jgi:hypothetical protein
MERYGIHLKQNSFRGSFRGFASPPFSFSCRFDFAVKSALHLAAKSPAVICE